MIYIGLNPREITDFDSISRIERSPFVRIFPDKVEELLGSDYSSCCNQNHKPVLDIIKRRFGIDVKISTSPMRHRLRKRDQVIIIMAGNIRRLEYEEKYTAEELRKSRILFRLYTINK